MKTFYVKNGVKYDVKNADDYLRDIVGAKKRNRYLNLLKNFNPLDKKSTCDLFIKNELYGGENGLTANNVPTKPMRFICNVPDYIIKDIIVDC